MANQVERAAGSIYDLGYRHYEGPRLGRWHAVTSLYTHSLRGVFGLGRHHSSKVIPFGLAVIALLPAVVQVGFVALAEEAKDILRPDDYYEFIQWPMALFVAAAGPFALLFACPPALRLRLGKSGLSGDCSAHPHARAAGDGVPGGRPGR
jgi:hypothetical protein